ncbi:16S rRNA (guanine(966)-N(2))-methyltransferase RsmD [Parvularcula sp. LCG005]|uniref:16S rRNA (guanine(966)-N(2))-methyltransferase RsmD n=1 Tax=Parvularcula sp. LCG005 TaxID=3078805 RepID=UPI002942A78D|nr:16S rRNA (guanine(966)-N(2))-methyltransferase RsmD [Parvularcula sp. LCG005]WOI52713.1 16S rRNA (guanine(966)-N(2))-methyltransferase RsmD [Parvularcula sp. LCG005]
MRIVGGQFKGRPIVAPKGTGTRPTTDRTRESVFNILMHRDDVELEGVRIIDLFAGSGALGFEAMSRGGSFCLFVETAASARGAIRDNQEALQLNGATRIHRRSATSLGAKPGGLGEAFTIAFLDPPYGQDLVDPALSELVAGGWMAPGALAVVEQGKAEAAADLAGIILVDERVFGDSIVRFYQFT